MNTSNNSDFTFVSDAQWAAYLKALCPYIGMGLWSQLTNLIIIISVLSHKDVRDKHFLLAGLALGDLSVGFGFTCCGSFRLVMIAAGLHKTLVSRLSCYFRPYTFFYVLGFQTTALISVVVSLERLIAVTWPIWYYQSNSKLYVKIAALVAIICVALSLVVGAVTASYVTAPVINYCLITDSMSSTYCTFNYGVNGMCGVATAVIYTSAVVVMRINMKRMANNATATKRLKTQAKIIKMMAAVLFVQFAVVATPNFGFLVAITLNLNYDLLTSIVPYLADAGVLSSGLNIFFYSIFNVDLRAAFLSTFRLGWVPKSKIGPQSQQSSNPGTAATTTASTKHS